MKKLLLVVVLLAILQLLSIAYANPVRVVGIGKTLDEAKQNAFKMAVQYRAGIVLLSDRESRNLELVKNEISAYSAGYVDNFNILSQKIVNGTYEITLEVFVSDSRISQRLLSNSTSIQNFETERHTEQINSLIHERITGDKLLKQVMNDYPLRAYNIQQLPYKIQFDSQRNLQLFVPYVIQWNPNFLQAFFELMNVIDEGKGNITNRYPGNVNIVSSQGYTEYRQQFRFFDLIRINSLRRHFIEENEVRLILNVKDWQGRVIGTKCYIPDFVVGKHKPMYSLGVPNTITIWGSEIERNHVQLNFTYSGDLSKVAQAINEIELKVSRDKDCGTN